MIVLDTCTIIWNALSPKKIPQKARRSINNAEINDGIIFCEISLWEIAVLMKKQRLRIDTNYEDFINLILSSNKYILKGISPKIAHLSVNLSESISQDPADRIIAATSILNNASLITPDDNLRKSNIVKTLWN